MSAARDTSALMIARASRTPMRLLMETMMMTTRTTRPYATPRRRTSANWNVMRRIVMRASSSAARSVARSAVRGPMVAVPPATRVGQLDRQLGDPQAPPLQPGRNLAAMVLTRANGLALCSCVCLSSATLKIYWTWTLLRDVPMTGSSPRMSVVSAPWRRTWSSGMHWPSSTTQPRVMTGPIAAQEMMIAMAAEPSPVPSLG